MGNEDWYAEIHKRLLAGDPVAPAELAETVWRPLVDALERRNSRLRGSELLGDAATDALVSYIKRPTQFNPSKRGLFGFLVMAAEGDLRNALAKTARRNRREYPVADVELAEADGNTIVEESELDAKQQAEAVRRRITAMFSDPRDRIAVQLLIEGERSCDVFAKVWGLQSLPPKERTRSVKRNKDRIKKAIKRKGDPRHGG